MDIFNNTSRKIRCVRNDTDVIDGYYGELLEIGQTYTVDFIEVDSWVTYVYLKEFPDKHFNSVLFEEIDNNA